MENHRLPVAIVGAGPVGLTAAAHLLARGIEPLILEAGPKVGASIEEWAHVKMFSPWQFNVDKEAAKLLLADGWTPPPENEYPTGRARNRYAKKRVLVVGGGHSAFNALQDLVLLTQEAPQTKVFWAIRGNSLERILGGGANDQLEERGKLGLKIRQLLNDGVIELFKNIAIDHVVGDGQGLVVKAGEQLLPPVDEIIVATGFRPDMSLLAELRIALDPATQSAVLLAPMIDPNEHSCGTVWPHGAAELAHPEDRLFIVGMKSYGRAPTFLLMTGYEQVRSVVAALAGDWDAAKRVELVLPETGVCNSDFDEVDDRLKASASQTSCCGTGEPILEAAPRTSPGCCKA